MFSHPLRPHPTQTHNRANVRPAVMIDPLPPIIQRPSPNFNERARPIRFIILHYTAIVDVEASIRVLSDPDPRREVHADAMPPPAPPEPTAPSLDGIVSAPPPEPPPEPAPPLTERMSRVSAHYVIGDDGKIYQLVDEAKRAWHAGAGGYGGEADMNSASIGIEINNGGHPYGLPPYPDVQIRSVMSLVHSIMTRHGLGPQAVIGHSDHAPGRKPDPGEHFPWPRLAAAGLALSAGSGPEDSQRDTIFGTFGQASPAILTAQNGLGTIGYKIDKTGVFDQQTLDVMVAFQRRFRQDKVDGLIDGDCWARIGRLVHAWTGENIGPPPAPPAPAAPTI